jgi:hypothetical protein
VDLLEVVAGAHCVLGGNLATDNVFRQPDIKATSGWDVVGTQGRRSKVVCACFIQGKGEWTCKRISDHLDIENIACAEGLLGKKQSHIMEANKFKQKSRTNRRLQIFKIQSPKEPPTR